MEKLKQDVFSYLQNKDMENLKKLITSAEEIELLQLLTDLTPNEQVIVFRLLNKDNALAVFEQLSTELQKQLLVSFKDEQAIELINEMTPDDRVALFEELPASITGKLIASLTPEERTVTNILMGYKEQTAGRIMTTEYITLRRDFTAGQAIEKVRKQAADKETVYILYVTDETKKLEGVLSLKDLIVANPDDIVGDIMFTKVIYVNTDTDQEEVAKTMKELDLLALPVVDKEGRIVGIVTIDDAIDILEEEVVEDILDAAGLVGEGDRGEVLIRGNLFQIWKVRLPFLFITLVSGMFAGSIIHGFEEILESVALVAIFIPLIMDMGGNISTQSSTIFARGVALGHINLKHFLKPFLKEISVGLTMGTILGTMAGIIITIWQGIPELGMAVGFSMIATSTLASLLGFFVPYILLKFNIDEAAGAGPLVTSIKDITGLLIYFAFVSLFLGYMIY